MTEVEDEEKPGRMRRLVRRLTAEESDLEAVDLQKRAESAGAMPVSDCTSRQRVTVAGTVRSMTLRPRSGAPTLEVELYDGSGSVTLIWLGRREIAGISPGRELRATGCLSPCDGRRIIFNPRYELIVHAP